MPGGIESTPIDPITGLLPLPVLMRGTDFYFKDSLQNVNPRPGNYHHHFHPRTSEELGYGANGVKLSKGDPLRLEGYGLRFSRGQEIPIWLHNRYHDIFYGPALPTDTKSKFASTVLACAGVIPRQAIDLYSSGEYKTKDLDDKQYDFIRRRIYFEGAGSKLGNSRRNVIGAFLANYILEHSVEQILDEKEVKDKVHDFLRPKSQQQRIEAGKFIIKYAIDASVAELSPLLNAAIAEGMVWRERRKLSQVVLKYFKSEKFTDYYALLEDRLAAIA